MRSWGVLVSVAGMMALGLATAPAAQAETAPALHNASTTVVAPGDLQSPTAVHIATPVSTQSTAASTHLAVAWAASDAGSGVASYDVRLRAAAWNAGFGAYIMWKPATTGHSATYVANPGRTVCFSVRARDHESNASSWSTDRCTTTPLDDRSLTAAGFSRASSGSAFGGTLSTTTTRAATLTRTSIVTRALAVIVSTCPSCGTLQARWNGKTIKTLNLAAPNGTHVVTLASFPKPTKGTLQLVVTTSGRRVTVDAVEIENTPATGSITLAGGAAYTNSTNVTVSRSIAGTTGAVKMRLANGSSLGATPYTNYSASGSFILSSGDGLKHVAAQFADAAGNVTGVATDDIMLDTTPPTVQGTSPGTAELSSRPVTVTASVDDASPLASVDLMTAPPGSSTFTTIPMTVDGDHFSVTLPSTQDSFEYMIRAVDAAGNVGTLPAAAPTDRFTVTIDPPPTSDQLIAAALATGTIDYPTSLLYRLWVQFGDPQLPTDFQGTGSNVDGEDQSLYFELIDERDQMSADQQAQVDRYLARPGDPGSAYAPLPPGSKLRRTDPTADCSQGLHFTAGPDVVVWSCAPADDPNPDPTRATVLADMEDLFPKEQADMGNWVSDGPSGTKNGGDGRLDVYVIPASKCVTNRSSTCEGIPSGAVARAVPAAPITTDGSRRTSSGFIIVGSDRVGKPTLKADLAHELFHILQYAHNWNALSRVLSPGAVPTYDNSWFAEASASWAEWYYTHDESKDDLYRLFDVTFQPENKSLLTFEGAADGHQYASWIWPLYMQEKGGASAIFNAWKGADSVSTPSQFDDVISNQLPFDKNFRNFSVRNWNEEMQGDPISPWTDAPMASDFPLGALHTATNTGTIGANSDPIEEPVKIDALAAQYDGYDIKEGVDKLTLDFSDVTNSDNLDVDILGRYKNNEWKHIAGDGPKVELCLQQPDEAFDFIRVVLSNHAKDRSGSGPDPAKQIQGAGLITTGTCARVEGTVSWTYNHSGTLPGTPNIHDDYSESGSMTVSFEPATFPGTDIPMPGFQVQDDGNSTFTRSMHETLDSIDDNGCETNISITGDRSGSFTPNPGPDADPTTATVFFNGFDPQTFDIGAVGKLSASIPVVDHAHAVNSGSSDSCPSGTSDYDIAGDNAPGGLTCTPKLPDGVTDPFGPGQFDGVMTDDGKGNVTFEFACSSATATTGTTTIQGPLNVSGTLYVHAGS